jgi:hypothetical protein
MPTLNLIKKVITEYYSFFNELWNMSPYPNIRSNPTLRLLLRMIYYQTDRLECFHKGPQTNFVLPECLRFDHRLRLS